MTPTLDGDSSREWKSPCICVQLGAKAQNVLSQFKIVGMLAQLVYQSFNCSANTSHRTMERASIDPNSDHEKPTRLLDIKPSVGPKA